MKNRYTVQDSYKVRLTADISPIDSSGDPLTEFSFTVATAPIDSEGRLILNFNDIAKKDKVYFHRTSGTTLYYYRKNRSNPSVTHFENDYVQMNNFADWFNYNFENTDDFGLIIDMGTNKAMILGGIVDCGNGLEDIAATAITELADGTRYAVFDYTDSTLKFVDTYTIATHYLVGQVVVTALDITTKTDRRYMDLFKNKAVLNQLTESAGNLLFNSNQLANDSDVTTNLANKVDKIAGKGLSEEDFTTAEKTKLGTLSEHFRGTYTTFAALEAAVPTGLEGDSAIVDAGAGTEALQYIRDIDDGWVLSAGDGAVFSVNGLVGHVSITTDIVPEVVNKRYLTDAERTKLTNTSNINSGDETQASIKSKLGAATDAADGYATSTQIAKLDGIEALAEVNTIDSDPTGIAGADQVTNIVSLTTAEYAAITTPDTATLYIITD